MLKMEKYLEVCFSHNVKLMECRQNHKIFLTMWIWRFIAYLYLRRNLTVHWWSDFKKYC